MRTALLSLSFVAVFIAAVSWLYFVVAFALWVFVFGDDSTTFGYYALAIAIPLALFLSAAYVGAAERWSAGPIVLAGVILVAAILEVIFLIAISGSSPESVGELTTVGFSEAGAGCSRVGEAGMRRLVLQPGHRGGIDAP